MLHSTTKRIHRTTFITLTILLLLAFTGFSAPKTPESFEHDGVTYLLAKADASAVRILWLNDSGQPMRTYPAALDYLKSKGENPIVLMNGGIFEQGGVPSGLLIQNGRLLRPLNLADGKGNFYLKPNGVFYVGENGAGVVDAAHFEKVQHSIQYAVQSGPLLVHHGQIHPALNRESGSRLHRNGVGVNSRGELIFIMSDIESPKYPNMYEFAELFLKLDCENALFLDGDLSEMRVGAEMNTPGNHIGSFIAIVSVDDSP